MIFLLCALAIYFVWVIAHTDSQLDRRASGDNQRLERYNQQVAQLEERMAGYIADSVESKLAQIEKRMSAGTVGPDEIRDFEELKSQILQLQKYTVGKDGNVTDTSKLDHPRLQPIANAQSVGSAGDVLGDIARVKFLAYLGLASCSVMALLVGGYWWRQETLIRKLTAATSPVPLLPAPPEQDG